MATLDEKVNATFHGFPVHKYLTKRVRGNAPVPSYVFEFPLG